MKEGAAWASSSRSKVAGQSGNRRSCSGGKRCTLRISCTTGWTNTTWAQICPTSYCQHERRYLRHFLAEERRLRAQPQPVLRIRGTEAAAFYACHFPRSHDHAWDVERLLHEELSELRAAPSDLLLYLHASVPTIRQRAAQDATKQRAKLSRWLEAWQAPTEAFFRSLPQTVVIDTDDLAPDEVVQEADRTLSRWFTEKGRIS